MSDKRPWSPGPWLSEGNSIYKLIPEGRKEVNQFWAGFQTQKKYCDCDELYHNAKLASKAPEWAELWIRLLKPEGPDNISAILDEAARLLKEVGWEGE